MTDNKMVARILWNDYYKVAWVNIITGEYNFVKILETDEEKPCLEGKTIYEYSKLIVSTGLVPQDDIEQYRNCTNRDNILREVLHNRKRVTVNFRRIIGSSVRWVRLEVVIPDDFSEEHPWVVYTWKESDAGTCNIEDAMHMLSQCFHKILRVDMTRDSFEVIKAYPQDLLPGNGYSEKFSEWVDNTLSLGVTYEADVSPLREFINAEHLCSRFRDDKSCQRLRYRRRYDGTYRWVCMELLPSLEYSDDNRIVMLYIRDIHDDYITELHHQKALEYFCNYDTLTGLHSRFCYNNFCKEFEQHSGILAALFADVNGLKFTNDTRGHEFGDQLIIGFAEQLSTAFSVDCCYRISGDEFVVLIEGIPEQDFTSRAEKFHKALQKQTIPPASVGWAWSGSADSVDELIRLAESRMYDDKRDFYKLHPEMKR